MTEPHPPEEPPLPSRTERWIRRAVIECGYLVFLLILLEVTLRVAGFLWLIPQHFARPGLEKSPGEFRILAIGESTTFGQGVSSDEAYPNVLERLLSESGKRIVRVVNTGVPGQTSTSILRNIEYQLETYRPDLVLALFGINDTNEALNDLSSRVAFGVPVPDWIAGLRTYRLACIVRDYVLHRPKVEDHGAWVFFDRDQKDERGDWILNPFYLDPLKRNAAEIIERVRSHGAEYVMISYLRSNEPLRQCFVEISEENRVPYLDLQTTESNADREFTADHFHPSEEGHRIMAEKIRDGLIERGLMD